MCLFVHMTNTTGKDAKARRRHVHTVRCVQCGVELTEHTRVAAHLVAYPCGLPCLGCVTLRSTCKSCNHAHSRKAPAFWGARVRLPLLRFVPGRVRRRRRHSSSIFGAKKKSTPAPSPMPQARRRGTSLSLIHI